MCISSAEDNKMAPKAKIYRPAGITILAFLEVIVGLFFLLCGALFSTIIAMLTAMDPTYATLLGSLAVYGSALFLGLGVLALLTAYLSWKGHKYGYYLSMLLWIIDIVITGIGIGLIIPLILIVYFLRKNVQDYFDVHAGWSWGS
jgi:hypothetical protein